MIKCIIPILLLISFSSNVFAQSYELKDVKVKNKIVQAYVFTFQEFAKKHVEIIQVDDKMKAKSMKAFMRTEHDFFLEKKTIDNTFTKTMFVIKSKEKVAVIIIKNQKITMSNISDYEK